MIFTSLETARKLLKCFKLNMSKEEFEKVYGEDYRRLVKDDNSNP